MNSFLPALERAIHGKQYGTVSILFMQILASEKNLKPYLSALPYMPHYDDNQFTEMLSYEQFDSVGLELLQNHADYYWRSPHAFQHFYHYNFELLHNHDLKKCFDPTAIPLWEKHDQFTWDNRLGHLCLDRLLEEQEWDECAMTMLYETLSCHSSKMFDWLESWDIGLDHYKCDVLDWVAYHYGFQNEHDYERWYHYTKPLFTLSNNAEEFLFIVDHAPISLLEQWFKDGILTSSILCIFEQENNHAFLAHILARLTYDTNILSFLLMYVDFGSNPLLKTFFFHENPPKEWSQEECLGLHQVLSTLRIHPDYTLMLYDYGEHPPKTDEEMLYWCHKKQKWDAGAVSMEEMSLFLTSPMT